MRAQILEREIDMENAEFRGSHLDPWVRKIQRVIIGLCSLKPSEKGSKRGGLKIIFGLQRSPMTLDSPI